jgi:hypothetical protein
MYLGNVSTAYDVNPEQKSMMLLTLMELWMQMDECATQLFPLLLEYEPGFPSTILDVLQLRRLHDMQRLQLIREYLQARHVASKSFGMTIFEDPTEGCFPERYYNESKDSSRLQAFHRLIESTAEEARIKKKEEWRARSLE